ncbi:glycosyltransferase family 2 protein [Leptolyngbya sp. FACHB-541]|uniref:glycosyltransferase family 2 protein n=1 Tax=Leptolyngbya sp. FACHB-541 TaxID=2692810 RepID=UPI001684C685|nr:glycosyltransferase family 2 protein [Leptolyngbya sp. FACHB-541]MBD1998491.1 glycosyltransferase family 2 protein [Leptolyngbya sp. FACHB-541]
MKKASVIVPVYGVEKYIAATLRSLLEQTYQNFEIILIDDASPDRSIEICQQFSDPRIKIIHQQNRGLAGARNTGIRHAEGDYIAFLDGDDLWLPEKLAKHIEHLENSPEVGISFSRSALIDSAGNSLNTYLMPKLTNITVEDLFRSNPIGNGSAAVIRRQVLEEIRFQDSLYGTVEDFYFDDRFQRSEDIECWLRIAIQTSWKIEGIPEALTLYRVNAEGLSANLLKQLESWEQVLEKVRSYAPEIVEEWGDLGVAYRLRYLARTAVRLKDGAMAVNLIHRAIATSKQILLEEPRRTLRTWFAAYLLYLLPQSLYSKIETFAAKAAGSIQKDRIQKEQIQQATSP